MTDKKRIKWVLENGTLIQEYGFWSINFKGTLIPGLTINDLPDIIDCEMPYPCEKDTDQELKDYCDELGHLGEPLTLSKLISSHRELRNLNMMHTKTVNEGVLRTMKHAEARAFEFALKNNWVSVDDLKNMTVLKLIELLKEDNE